jgi:formamidopyrimidine-DNA glycosylase
VPELPEVEFYRRLAESSALGRPIAAVQAADTWYLKGGIDAATLGLALVGRRFVAARRIGKLALLDTDLGGGGADGGGGGVTLGLRFGMTGRLIVDGVAGVDQLLYSSVGVDPRWERFAVVFADGGRMSMLDPRRLGGVMLDPDESRLGTDLLTLTPASLRRALGTSTSPLKARLMDQARIAGIGNLIADEALWRAGLDPARPACSLTAAEIRRLARHLAATTSDFIAGGGSHTGELLPARVRDGRCPRDGHPLLRRTIGGRTTYSCPHHQH